MVSPSRADSKRAKEEEEEEEDREREASFIREREREKKKVKNLLSRRSLYLYIRLFPGKRSRRE